MTTHNTNSQPSGKSVGARLAKPAIILVCVMLVATVLWQLLPKSAFSSDMTQLGQGRPGLVLLREVHVMGGERVLEQMHALYPEFEQEMVFLVVHTGNPTGINFASEHNVGDGGLVVFSAEGQPLGSLHHPESAAVLRRFITETLATANN